MKKTEKLLLCVFLVASLMVCGAWIPYENTPTETRYGGEMLISTYANETISYTRKEVVEQKLTDGGAPQYVQSSGMENACGAVAGTVIIGFYDKYFPNLIPDWQSFFPANGRYRAQDKVYIPAIMNELYISMRTNVDDVGVSESDFIEGLNNYINSKGYRIGYDSVANATAINYEACKKTVDNNKVVVLFAREGDIYQIASATSYDRVSAVNVTTPHIMVAYGYRKINYYNASGLFRTDTYLEVITGKAGAVAALYKINPHNLDSAYTVNIS